MHGCHTCWLDTALRADANTHCRDTYLAHLELESVMIMIIIIAIIIIIIIIMLQG